MIDPADAYYLARDFPEPESVDEGPCHFCGGPTPCDCTTKCKHCPHIGHEHYADGRCRGTNYDKMPLVEEPCEPHQYEPETGVTA